MSKKIVTWNKIYFTLPVNGQLIDNCVYIKPIGRVKIGSKTCQNCRNIIEFNVNPKMGMLWIICKKYNKVKL